LNCGYVGVADAASLDTDANLARFGLEQRALRE
jgi:hypothetical protein